MEKKKQKYEKPKVTAKKLKTYFFACLKNVPSGCTSYLLNKSLGAGCPN